jgi:hypothetical protein
MFTWLTHGCCLSCLLQCDTRSSSGCSRVLQVRIVASFTMRENWNVLKPILFSEEKVRLCVGVKIILVLVEITNNMPWFVPLLCSMYWLLHVSAVACHYQRASWTLLSYLKYKSNGRYIIECVVMWPVCRVVVVRLLHIPAVAYYHQGSSWILMSYLKYKSNGWYII